MRRKSTKIAAALMSAMLMLQSGWSGMQVMPDTALLVSAQETEGQEENAAASEKKSGENAAAAASEEQAGESGAAGSETQAVAKTPTEAQTQAPTETEAQTQAPTEAQAQTQAPTEAQTQAPTEVQTQAPTEVQTQAPTEAQTQVPTETQTQAPTEAQTQAPTETATEDQTQADTEKTTEKATEKETERWQRKNDGKKMTASGLVSELKEALPYLLAAETVTVPDALKEALGMSDENADGREAAVTADTLVAQKTEGAAIVSGLKSFSVELANAKSSSDVEVINLYADKDGRLDTAQLEEKFENGILDVTKKYVVINVIADHADQSLQFSGYEMVRSGRSVDYKEETQPGDILYNFAAMKNDEFVGYKGTVTLTDRLQGTFLAPEADVKVNANLAGAVFADTVAVADSVTELLHIVFVDGKDAETEAEADGQTAAGTDGGTEAEADDETAVTEENTEEDAEEGEAAEATESIEAAESETVTVVETEIIETEGMSASAAGEEASAVTDTQAGITDASESTSEAAQPEDLLELVVEEAVNAGGWEEQSEMKTAAAVQADVEAAETVSLTVSVVDESDPNKQISSAAFVVKEASGTVLQASASASQYYFSYAGAKTEFKLNPADLQDGAHYYLSQISTSVGYLIDSEDKEFEFKDGKLFFVSAEGTEAGSEITIFNTPVEENTASLTLTARTYYNDVLLNAVQAGRHYAALFADEDLTKRVSAVQAITYEAGKTESTAVVFAGLAQNATDRSTYYLAETDEYGTALTAGTQSGTASSNAEWTSLTWIGDVQSNEVSFQAAAEGSTEPEKKTARLDFCYAADAVFPTGEFSYPVDIHVTKNVLDQTGSEASSDETFYFNIYRTAENTSNPGEKVFENPVAIVMDGAASASVTCQLMAADVSESFAIREVDAGGSILTTETGSFQYAVSYPSHPNGTFTVNCESAVNDQNAVTGTAVPVGVTIENRKTDSLVTIQAKDAATGGLISGIPLVIKTKAGKVVLINDQESFTSGESAIQLENVLTPGKTYYLSAPQAPRGYAPAADVAFTVNKSGETVVSLEYEAAKATDYKLTVSKQVYSGKNQVYAYDTTSGAYAAKGAYTFYVALFADAARTQKVSDVQTVTVSGLGGTTVFKNLEKGKTYYVGETDQYGQLRRSTTKLTVKYSNKGVVTMTEKSRTSVIQNSYSSLPEGYRYTGTLTITKKVTGTSGSASKVTETFYAGIYRTADYSDTPTIVKLDLKDASSVSVKRRILLSGTKDMVYYIAEVDAEGNRITDSSDFVYSVKIDSPTVTVSRGTNASVTITNQTKATKATLYLTKKVYSGTTLQASNETFYAGLFKDAQFTKPYTRPIALNMNGKSELTLKLSLNLGTASNVKIYVAEVDAEGNVIKDEKSFGYEVKLINSTAEFTPDRREVQTILLNSKYGTSSSDDWNSIFSSDGNDIGSISGGYWGVSGNGDVSEAAQTGDATPVMTYAALMGAAMAVLLGGLRRRRSA